MYRISATSPVRPAYASRWRMRHCRDFIRLNHWHYGNRIIKTAERVAQTDGLFPLYVTAFKCAPDSFIIEYFKAIMDYYRKPYLILQLDEHEAAEGYDTRLEAAVETFRLFRGARKRPHRPTITLKSAFEEKTYLLPGYDLLSARLMQGALTHAGIKTMVVEQTPDTISQSLRINDGQCLPVSILTQGIRHRVSRSLDYCARQGGVSYREGGYGGTTSSTDRTHHGSRKVNGN